MGLLKAVFYLPIRDNAGRDLRSEIIELRSELFLRFGGYTFQGHYQGAFRMSDGSRSEDVTAVYMVLVDSSELPQLEERLAVFKRSTGQEALYLEIQHGVEVKLL